MKYIFIFIIILLLFIIYFDSYSIKTNTINLTKYFIYRYVPFIKPIKNPSEYDLYNLLNQNIELPKLDNYDIIPNRLFQTYHTKSQIPIYISDNIKKYATNYEYVLYDDNQAIDFLIKYFDKRIVDRFNNLKLGAHKADLLRYCYLYIYGGIYLDIKIILIENLDSIFTNKSYFYTCISYDDHTIHNAIIASKPRNKIFLKLIWYIVNIPIYYINYYYLSICRDLYIQIQDDLVKKSKLNEGLNLGKSQNYYLFQEKIKNKIDSECTKLDRYGLCANIYDKEKKIFIGRDPEFPWK